jgi:hypothetical protein
VEHPPSLDFEISVALVIHVLSLDRQTVFGTVNESGIPRVVEVVEPLDYGEHC